MQLDRTLRMMREDASAEALAARAIARAVRARGGRAWLVGGGVRDALLGRACKDWDIEVHGIAVDILPAIIKEAYPAGFSSVGESFGVVKLHHLDVDVALPRRETRIGEGHKDFAVDADPFLGIREAAARRDFTINAIYADPLDGTIEDPWNGAADLEANVLRHVSEHFAEDPLRVLRAMQFLARFPELEAAPETIALCSTMTQEHLPFERCAAEWEKLLLKGAKPSRGLEFLRSCGWIKRFYPSLHALIGCEQSAKYHPEGDVWIHTLLALDATVLTRGENEDDNLAVALAALCHDLGKPAVSCLCEDGLIHAYNHEIRGEKPAAAFTLSMWNRPKFAELVGKLVRLHMRPVQLALANAGAKAYRKLAVEAGRMDLLTRVVEADMRATLTNDFSPLEKFRAKAKEFSVENEPPRAILLGRHLIALGMKPGPAFHDLLAAAYDAQLGGEFTDEPSAIEWLRAARR